MHTDFENALIREPVQAILNCIMSYTTEAQRKVIYEKLGRRVVPIPASLEQEAEKIYPYPNRSEHEEYEFEHLKERQQSRRQAHITAARQYMGEIERLKAENDTLSEELGELKEIQQGIETLKAENEKMRKVLKAILKRCGDSGNDYGQAVYEISEISYEAIKIDFNF